MCGLLIEAILAAEALAQREYEAATMAGLLDSLGRVSPARVRLTPAPGLATVADTMLLRETMGRIYELIDGSLVETIADASKPLVATKIYLLLDAWNHDRGFVDANRPVAFAETLVRIPDVSFTNWDRLPNRQVPDEPVPKLAPDLAVEVLSEGNTRAEMERKLKEYFLSEVQLVWCIDPRKRLVQVYTSPDDVTELGPGDTLDGGDVLPGFAVEVANLFDQLAPAAKPAKPKANGGKKPKKRK